MADPLIDKGCETSPSEPPNVRFQGRGVLSEDALYVERPADRQLVRELARGVHCHVLAPRQVGKTNLRLRATAKLRRMTSPRGERIRCAAVDLMSIGGEASAEQWYYGLIERVLRQLRLDVDLPAFWAETGKLSFTQRLFEAMLRLVLAATRDAVVLFLDEINVALDLPFSGDELFRAILAMQNARGEEPAFERLTICLIGVATPIDFVDDLSRTPFNKSLGIELEDFTRQEAEAFRRPLAVPGDPDKILDEVWSWTHGHPALMQQLCEKLTSESCDDDPDERSRVHDLVGSLYLSSGRTDDPILLDIHDRFAGTGPRRRHATEMLQDYRTILQKEKSGERTAATHGAHLRLRILGMIAVRRDPDGTAWLHPRNPIFKTVFDLGWVDARLRERSYLTDPLTLWLVHEKSEEFALSGRHLEDALAVAKERTDVPAEEREFLIFSRDVADRRRREQEEVRREREEERRAQESERKKHEEERRAQESELRKHQEERERERKWRRRGMVALSVLLILLPAVSFGITRLQRAALEGPLDLIKRAAEDAKSAADKKAEEAEARAKQAQEDADLARREAQRASDDARAAGQQASKAESRADEASRLAREADRRKQDALWKKQAADRQKQEAEAAAEVAKSEADVQRQRAEWARSLVADTKILSGQLSDAILRAERAEADLKRLRAADTCQARVSAAEEETRECEEKLRRQQWHRGPW